MARSKEPRGFQRPLSTIDNLIRQRNIVHDLIQRSPVAMDQDTRFSLLHSVVHTVVFMDDDLFAVKMAAFMREDPVLCMIALRFLNALICFSDSDEWECYLRLIYDMDDQATVYWLYQLTGNSFQVSNIGVKLLKKLLVFMEQERCDEWSPLDLQRAIQHVAQVNSISFKQHIQDYFGAVFGTTAVPFTIVPYFIKRVDKHLARRKQLLALIDCHQSEPVSSKRPRLDQ